MMDKKGDYGGLERG